MKKLITLFTAILMISCTITACTPAPTTETQDWNNWNQNAYGNYNNVYAGSDVSPAPSYNGNQNYSNNGGYQNSNSDVDEPSLTETWKIMETETQVGACNHSYSFSSENCSKCGELHPAVAATSLEIPTLPLVINEYDYNNELKSSVKVTKIEVVIDRMGDSEEINISVNFSGTKTYDKNGSGQSSSVKIGWKLYDADGNVEETGIFYAPKLAMGESFANKSEKLISYSAAGKYRLEILNVN